MVQLIFAQGFSTREAVTELSGRGVGLDVVLKSIERLNGLVEVETVPGVGTKFIIQLPLTLAIISALLVEVAGRTYAIPLGSVVESLKFDAGRTSTRINGRETLRIRDRIVPARAPGRRCSAWRRRAPGAARSTRSILGRGDKRVGLVVDRLQRPAGGGHQGAGPRRLGRSDRRLAGATIMGDGRVVLILDVAALFEGRRHSVLQGRARRRWRRR